MYKIKAGGQRNLLDKMIAVPEGTDPIALFDKLLNEDKGLREAILFPIEQRLKVASGTLINNIVFKVNVDTKRPKLSGENMINNLVIGIYINEHVQALFGENDPHPIEIPTTQELVSYINDKRKFFSEGIDDIKNRRKRMMLAKLNSLRNFSKKITNYPDSPVEEIAKIIQLRMVKRASTGKSPLKGSEYVFLGLYKSTFKSDKQKTAFIPRYKKEERPLLTTVESKEIGIINELLTMRVNQYMEILLGEISKIPKFERTITSLFTYAKKTQALFNEKKFTSPQIEQTIELLSDVIGKFKHSKKTKAYNDMLHLVEKQMKYAEGRFDFNGSEIKSEINKLERDFKTTYQRAYDRTKRSAGRRRG